MSSFGPTVLKLADLWLAERGLELRMKGLFILGLGKGGLIIRFLLLKFKGSDLKRSSKLSQSIGPFAVNLCDKVCLAVKVIIISTLMFAFPFVFNMISCFNFD